MKGYLQSLPVVGKIFLDVQPEEVWAFWRFMQDHFRTSVINKRSALEMQLVARGLEALGIQSKDRFLKNFTTTIGRRIYTPFEVGSPKGGWDLWHQIVICVHEHQHVVQHDREGLSYEVSYLADRAARARWLAGLSTDDPALPRMLADATRAVAQRRHFRTVLDRINARRAAQAQVEGADHRRLALSEQLLAEILTHTTDAIVSLDPAGVVRAWNRGAEVLFGTPESEAVGRPLADAAVWSEDIRELLSRRAAGESVFRRALRCATPTRQRHVELTLSAIRERDGSTIGWAVILPQMLAMLGGVFGDGLQVLLGVGGWRFYAPVFVGDHVAVECAVLDVSAAKGSSAGAVPQWYMYAPANSALNWYTSRSPDSMVRISSFQATRDAWKSME